MLSLFERIEFRNLTAFMYDARHLVVLEPLDGTSLANVHITFDDGSIHTIERTLAVDGEDALLTKAAEVIEQRDKVSDFDQLHGQLRCLFIAGEPLVLVG